MSVNPVNSINYNKSLSFCENPKDSQNSDNKAKMSTQTKVLLGTTLAALACTGIYLLTRGRTKPQIENSQNISDIIEEGVDMGGDKYKKIIDAANNKWKEYITYFANGKVKRHTLYDSKSSIKFPDNEIKCVSYAENGNIESLRTYYSPGIPRKDVRYFTDEESLSFGPKVFVGTKYHPNGKKRFEMAGIPGGDFATAKLYDINGNLIRTKYVTTPKGRARGFQKSILNEE